MHWTLKSILLVALFPLLCSGCAIMADTAVTVVATMAKIVATVVGTAVDVTAAGVKAVVGSLGKEKSSIHLWLGQLP